MKRVMGESSTNVMFYVCLVFYFGDVITEAQYMSGKADTVHRASDGTGVFYEPSVADVIVKRSTTKIVDIAMFKDSSAAGKQYSVYVDETMTRLIIHVQAEISKPVAMVTKPSGLPGPHPILNNTAIRGTHIATIDTAITAADYGIWTILKMDANTWSVKVQGESPLEFTYQFLKGSVRQIPVTGDPIQGEIYKTVITVPEYAKIQTIDQVMIFITEKSAPAHMMLAIDRGNGKYETSIKMIKQEFIICIEGKDDSGYRFRRISSFIKPVTLSLSVPSYVGVKLYENAALNIAFSVVNELSAEQDIDVRIKDTHGYAEAPVFISDTLAPGDNFTGKFVIKGGLAGETTIVTITATQYLGFGKGFTLGPSETRQFTVERNNTTTFPTTTEMTTPTITTQTTSTTTRRSTTSTSTTVSTPSSSVSVRTSIASTVSKASSVVTTKKEFKASTPLSAATNGLLYAHSSIAQSMHIPATSLKPAMPVSAISATYLTTNKSLLKNMSANITSTTSSVATADSSPTVSLPSTSTASTAIGRVPVALGSTSVKTVSLTFGKSLNIPVTSKDRPVPLSVQKHLAISMSSVASEKNTVNQTTTTTTDANEEERDMLTKDVFTVAIASGISAGVILGIAALVMMGFVFKKGKNKRTNAVAPDKKKQTTLSEHNELAWV